MKRLLLTLLAVVVGLVVHATDYKLVTDVSQLEVGARYLVVGTNTKGTYAMGNLKKDNHYAIPVEITDNTVTVGDQSGLEATKQIAPVELVTTDDSNYPYGLKVGEKFLYASSTTKNHLKDADNLDNYNSHASIEIASNGVATIKFNNNNLRNWLRLNDSEELFACYTTGQKDIYLYKEVAGVVTPDPDPDPSVT